MKIAVLFPGQGSQFLGMGQEFIKDDPASADLMAMAEAVCGLKLGALIADGPMEELTRATNLQPAITITNLICWQRLHNELGGQVAVSCMAGHSLGEYSALCASGVIGVEDTIRLVGERGALMEREGNSNPGGMRAVLGLDSQTLDAIIEGYKGEGVVTAANHNTPEQIVISGSLPGLDGVTRLAEEKGARVIPLNVSVANHSPLVAAAIPDFKNFMRRITFNPPKIPIYFNVSAKVDSDPETIKDMMARQIASKVRWCEIIESMLADGVDTFIEVGPKAVLKGMIKKIAPKGTKITALQFDSPSSLASCLEALRKEQ
ncbi:MAG: ACP S-malonyltransferase [Desulforhopalus sp.]|nr:ACP S-malonyltransferase [Desulforhopalus sp.]